MIKFAAFCIIMAVLAAAVEEARWASTSIAPHFLTA